MSKKSELIKQQYPQINWARFEDIDRALNFELWYGTANEYWGHAEDLEYYTWEGLEKACKDLEEILEPLPYEMWFDCDGESIVTDTNPGDYDGYWNYDCLYCEDQLEYEFRDGKSRYIGLDSGNRCEGNDGAPHEPDLNKEAIWVGGEWEEFNVREELMFDETYKQIF